ncbi:hypothetical protein [Streptomyces sp. NPDC007856]|uniref:hypothetical protein n=1 Tax=Streptomyces sp. NPDC007856 TaxID=3364781 RepID=UPI0036917DB0
MRHAARQLAETTPKLTAGSADAYRAGLATRAADLRRAALAAWITGIPEDIIAADGRLPVAVVHGGWRPASRQDTPATDDRGGQRR